MADAPLMFGSVRAKVFDCAPVSIHGDAYFDVIVALGDGGEADEPPERGFRLRIAGHLCERPPAAGDTLELTFLMQQVNGVRFL